MTAEPSHAARFLRLCEESMRERHVQGEAGIGTLGEKRMHSIIKRYLCEDVAMHEVGVLDTRYVADVRIGNEIYEVQTGAFHPMKRKIAHYLENTDCTVTVVHPILVNKWVSRIDPSTGEISARKKSPKHETPMALLARMYPLISYLSDARLRFRLLLLEVHDFRIVAPPTRRRRRDTAHYECVPLALLDEMDFSCRDDFAALLPSTLPERFTVKDFSKHTKLRGRDAYSAVRALAALGVIERAESIGRSMGWRTV